MRRKLEDNPMSPVRKDDGTAKERADRSEIGDQTTSLISLLIHDFRWAQLDRYKEFRERGQHHSYWRRKNLSRE